MRPQPRANSCQKIFGSGLEEWKRPYAIQHVQRHILYARLSQWRWSDRPSRICRGVESPDQSDRLGERARRAPGVRRIAVPAHCGGLVIWEGGKWVQVVALCACLVNCFRALLHHTSYPFPSVYSRGREDLWDVALSRNIPHFCLVACPVL